MARRCRRQENDGDKESMEDALHHRLLEIIPTFTSEALPMDIGNFFQSRVAVQNVGIEVDEGNGA